MRDHPRLDHPHDLLSLCRAAVLGEPAWRFGDAEPQNPRDDRPTRADNRDPAPAVDAERRIGHQRPGEECSNRIRRRADQRGEGECRAAPLDRHQLRQIGVDCDELDADPDAGEKAPEDEAGIGRLKGHDEGGDAIPDERGRKHRAPPEIIRQRREALRPDQHPGEGRRHEARVAVDVEKALRRRHHDPGFVETGGDERDEPVVEHVEKRTQRQQHDKAAHIG